MAIIIFDFDDTLFDTQKLKEKIFDKLFEYGISKEIIHESYKESQNLLGVYSPENHTKILRDLYNFDVSKKLNDWIANLDLSSHIFPEVDSLLKDLKNNNHLILLTRGKKNFQTFKIDQSDISRYFHETHIIEDAKEIFLKGMVFDEEVYFINDKESENSIIKDNFPNFHIIKKEHGKPIQLSMLTE